MVFPAVTAFYGALLALLFALLSVWVIAGRFQFGVLHGDGKQEAFGRRMRAQANFAEYVPLILLLTGLYEADGGSRAVVRALLLVLLVARLLHPIGMLAPVNSPQQYACRGGGAMATLTILSVAALLLLTRVV